MLIEESCLRNFFGGIGFGVFLLFDIDIVYFDVFDFWFLLVIVFSLLVGSLFIIFVCFVVVLKSFFINCFNDLFCGSCFVIVGKLFGVDVIMIEG